MDRENQLEQLRFQAFYIFTIMAAITRRCDDIDDSHALFAFDAIPSRFEDDSGGPFLR